MVSHPFLSVSFPPPCVGVSLLVGPDPAIEGVNALRRDTTTETERNGKDREEKEREREHADYSAVATSLRLLPFPSLLSSLLCRQPFLLFVDPTTRGQGHRRRKERHTTGREEDRRQRDGKKRGRS